MLAIKNNLMAENSSRHVAASYDALAKSVERLSSGLRIVGAADDAAGLAVRELMRADVAVLKQGARNAQDGVSMLQTAEGALQTVDEMLVRMKELAEQAATGVYSDTQRGIMNDEFGQLANEIDRIAATTKFNGISLLNSASGTVTIHVGTANTDNDKITISMADTTKGGLGVDSISIAGQDSAAAALSAIDSAIATKDSARASFGYMMNRLEATASVQAIQAENLLASESRISDVDVASEMSALTRSQVLAQAGTSMLAQANSMPQLVLTLLR
jgi:flagellin